MTEAVIVAGARTAVGTAYKGTLTETTPEEMARVVVGANVERSALDPELIDDVIMAESGYGGGAVARHAAIEAGLINAAGASVGRHCAGSLTAVQSAAGSIRSGMDRVVIAGGVHTTSLMPRSERRVPGTTDYDAWGAPSHPATPEAPNLDMSITVGWNTARIAGLSRLEQDQWAARSHERAIAAIDAGNFVEEIVAIDALRPDGSTVRFEVDEHPRRQTSLEKLAGLKVIHPEIEGFSVTAGNSSGLNDAASAVTVVSSDVAAAEKLDAMATVLSWANVGINPERTGFAVVDVIPKALQRAGLSIADIALWEINEAFASVPVAACKQLEINDEIVNTSGSGCSIGHPVAASGTRMLNTLVRDLRRRGGGYGVAAMCAGGGQAGALVVRV
ncbi:thiolase family protein [Gordonia polyisoprenivorans]|uniref:thiolase family protein n=1 Tax=Gordonia polyisoprenivorans TaxID=84595 RepID=UPI001AD72DD1|nr:thiolase family protein [Gordonia polyisoprenivorans]QTI70921.1 thiolase family protein [Gordonia polyisoprenivorans]